MARTNLLLATEALGSAKWARTQLTSLAGGQSDPDGGDGAFIATPASDGWYILARKQDGNTVLTDVGDVFTFSVWLRAPSATKCRLCARYIRADGVPYSSNASRLEVDVTTEWQRFSLAGTLSAEQTTDSVWVGQGSADPVYIYHPKLERGSDATDWRPNPADISGQSDMVLGTAEVTIIDQTDMAGAVMWYQLSTSATKPAKPITTDASATPTGWSKAEPGFDATTTNYLYTTLQTIWGDGTCDWGDVQLSSAYESAKLAYNQAVAAGRSAQDASDAAAMALLTAQPNLVPWFSAGDPKSGVGGSYWKYAGGNGLSAIQFTKMGDGWYRMLLDNTNGTSVLRFDYDPVAAEEIECGKNYTFLFEFRNIQGSTGTSRVYAVQAATYGMQFWGDSAQEVLQGTGTSCTTFINQTIAQSGANFAVLCDDGVYRKRVVRSSEASDSTYWTRSDDKRCVRLVTYCNAGAVFDAEMRFSIYEGEYYGPYKPYVDQKLRQDVDAAQADATQAIEDASNAQDTANQAINDAANAAKVATNYLHYNATNGLDVGYSGTQARTNVSGGGVTIYDQNGVDKFNASASGVRVGRSNNYHAMIDADSFELIDSNGDAAFSADTSRVQIGKSGDYRAVTSPHNFTLLDSGGSIVFYVGEPDYSIEPVEGWWSNLMFGKGLLSEVKWQTLLGKYNVNDTNDLYALIIGNGTSTSNRKNIFTVGWDGSINRGTYTNFVATNVDGTVGETVSGNAIIGFRDTSNTLYGYMQARSVANGIPAAGDPDPTWRGVRIGGGAASSGKNYIDILGDASGNKSYALGSASAFRDALGMSNTSISSGFIEADDGQPIPQVMFDVSTFRAYKVFGRMVQFYLVGNLATSLAAGGSIQLGTIPAGYRPVLNIGVNAHSTSRRAVVSTAGTVTLSSSAAIASGGGVTISGMYLTAS